MSTPTPGSILKFKTFSNEDKAYTIKLLGSVVTGILMGIVSAIVYTNSNLTIGFVGLAVYILQSIGLGLFLKKYYNLDKMSNGKAIRHGIMMGFFVFLYLWITVFDFIVVPL